MASGSGCAKLSGAGMKVSHKVVRKTPLKLDRDAIKCMMKYAWKNLWRVSGLGYDINDLIQDGHLAAAIAEQRYGLVAVNQAHLLTLFMRIFANMIHNMAHGSAFWRDNVAGFDDVDALAFHAASTDDMATFIGTAPDEIRDVLTGFVNASGDQLREPYRCAENGVRETLNDRLCRIGKIENQPGIHSRVRQYLEDGKGKTVCRMNKKHLKISRNL